MKLTGFSAALVLAGSAAASPLVHRGPPKYGVPESSTPSTPATKPSSADPTLTPIVTPTVAPSLPPYGIPSVSPGLPEVKPTGGIPPVCSFPTEDIPDGTPAELPDVDGLDSSLLAQLLPGVISIINGLGLGGLAPGLLGLLNLNIVTNSLEIVDLDGLLGGLPIPEISGLSVNQVTKIVTGLLTIVKVLKLDEITSSGVLPQVEGITPELLQAILNFVTALVGKLGLQSVFTTLHVAATNDVPDLLVAGGLLAQLGPVVAGLLNILGLGALAPLLVTLLNSLSVALYMGRMPKLAEAVVGNWTNAPRLYELSHFCVT
ncbi:conserved hypothetical protein [Histoplasma capsulatum var. duboisii H88]|uniref:Uncharacterized protein n=3 Tax=Ajellomyces capsulatus TaxID=5037 RepID=F0UTY1_AJEC8|nr:conserved hypothetical protein [Histoplasma capsulatum H143]EGC49358.1 conserved hypothetical protein [Histoplasma capsulatum var. duboisii H88]